jgi:leucyl aminopeptidase
MAFIKSALAFSLLTFNLIFSPVFNGCDYDPLVSEMLAEAKPSRWIDWMKALSGAEPIYTQDGEEKILTRSSLVLFEPDRSPSAFTYLLDELVLLGFKEGEDFQVHTYDFPYQDRYPERNWKNIILTFPGYDPEFEHERVLFVAHMDSTSEQELLFAPGADDNASGTAGLLEAAAVFRQYRFRRTINLVWFSGEEKFRIGSKSFVEDYADWIPDIVGVVNMDMIAYDGDKDRCFEVHAGTLPGSQEIGNCIGSVIDAYDLDLTFDFIDDSTAYRLSDHLPFWQQDVPAVMLFENFFYQPEETCGQPGRNFTYHTARDTMTYINQSYGFSVLQAGIGTVAHLAQPIEPCFSDNLQVTAELNGHKLRLNWTLLADEGAQYQIWAKEQDHWQLLGETNGTEWVIPLNPDKEPVPYLVTAINPSGCQSKPAEVFPTDYFSFDKLPK